MTQFGAVIVIEPFPVTWTAGLAVRLRANRQYCSLGDVGATIAVEEALMFIEETPKTLMNVVGTMPFTLAENVPFAFRAKLGVSVELPFGRNVPLKTLSATLAQLAVLSRAPASIAESSAACSPVLMLSAWE